VILAADVAARVHRGLHFLVQAGQAHEHDKLAPFEEVDDSCHVQVVEGQLEVEKRLHRLRFEVLVFIDENRVHEASQSVQEGKAEESDDQNVLLIDHLRVLSEVSHSNSYHCHETERVNEAEYAIDDQVRETAILLVVVGVRRIALRREDSLT